MNYTELKNHLLVLLKKNNFKGEWEKGYTHSKIIELENDNNICITISFPGKKTKEDKYGLKYDYLVYLNGRAVTHCDIVRNIYNRVNQLEETQLMYDYLNDLVILGHEINLEPYLNLDQVDFDEIQEETQMFSIQELTRIIPYIAVQEDINYPMPRAQGRRLSFCRYIEAILCTCENEYSIDDVIERTSQKWPIPELWEEYNANDDDNLYAIVMGIED